MTKHHSNFPALRLLATTILGASLLTSCGGSDDPVIEPTPKTIALARIGSFEGGALGAAEITAFDAASKRLFVVNGANGTVDVLDLSNPAVPRRIDTISAATIGAVVNSVAVFDGLVALAIEASPKTSPGTVAFYNAADLKLITSVKVGAQPDMLAFSPDGRYLLVANEGEPNSYGLADSVDPEGSISVITVNRGATPMVATSSSKSAPTPATPKPPSASSAPWPMPQVFSPKPPARSSPCIKPASRNWRCLQRREW